MRQAAPGSSATRYTTRRQTNRWTAWRLLKIRLTLFGFLFNDRRNGRRSDRASAILRQRLAGQNNVVFVFFDRRRRAAIDSTLWPAIDRTTLWTAVMRAAIVISAAIIPIPGR